MSLFVLETKELISVYTTFTLSEQHQTQDFKDAFEIHSESFQFPFFRKADRHLNDTRSNGD